MKNQYFGDRRDFFKYDLLLDLVGSHGNRRLTFIPMLTPNDRSGEGQLTRYECAGRRSLLFESLRTAVNSGERDIRLLRTIMPGFGVRFNAHRDADCFEHESRTLYFDSVPDAWLAEAVIFFDPDVGLQTGSRGYMRQRGFQKYLMYSDLTSIWNRASANSVVVVYQHLQRNALKHPADIRRRLADLKTHLAVNSVWAIRQGDLALLVAVQDDSLARRTGSTLQNHALRHSLVLTSV
jgi:hypothetical protein